MLKRLKSMNLKQKFNQPPSGGCVLKPVTVLFDGGLYNQPPSGGCVLKPQILATTETPPNQPPSGGCVLKICHRISCLSRDEGLYVQISSKQTALLLILRFSKL